ncbi:MAG TPA: DUF3899 domain-containing protein [Sporosarcina psychrophila]|uniref:DUF3899 domain-containing protein n=1 Tax=Sporosarcina psychrophila TaxID=1476 RepID=A0A921FVC6_SPOPS|nr:DUF3899 domain-containing protein [Sporosarcina psychrophila]
MKVNVFVASFSFIVWLLISKIGNLSLLEITNLTFIVGLIALLIYSVIYIIQSNFLNLFIDGFKKINYLMFPQSRSSKRAEELAERDYKLNEWKLSVKEVIKRMAAVVSITTLGISLVCLALDYWII